MVMRVIGHPQLYTMRVTFQDCLEDHDLQSQLFEHISTHASIQHARILFLYVPTFRSVIEVAHAMH